MDHDMLCRATDGVILHRQWACQNAQSCWEHVWCHVDGKVVPQHMCGFEHKGGLRAYCCLVDKKFVPSIV